MGSVAASGLGLELGHDMDMERTQRSSASGLSTFPWHMSDRCSAETIPWEFPGLATHDPLSCCELQHMVSCNSGTTGALQYALLHGWLLPTAIAKEHLYLACLCPDSGHTALGRVAVGAVACFP